VSEEEPTNKKRKKKTTSLLSHLSPVVSQDREEAKKRIHISEDQKTK